MQRRRGAARSFQQALTIRTPSSPQHPIKQLPHNTIGEIPLQLTASSTKHTHPPRPRRIPSRQRQRRLTNPRRPLHQQHPTRTTNRTFKRTPNPLELPIALEHTHYVTLRLSRAQPPPLSRPPARRAINGTNLAFRPSARVRVRSRKVAATKTKTP